MTRTRRGIGPAALLLAATPAWAAGDDPCTQSAVTALPSIPGGACWDGSHLWVADFFTTTLRRIDVTTGQEAGQLQGPGKFAGGLAWDGTALWVGPEQAATLYRVDPGTGAVLHSIPTPGAGSPDPNGSGLAWDGEALWHADYGRRKLYRLDPADGAVLAEWDAPGDQPAGLGWRAGMLVVADPDAETVHRVDAATGEVLGACPAPTGTAWGVAVDLDTRALVVRWNPVEVVEVAMDLSGGGPPDFWETVCEGRPSSLGGPARLEPEGSPSVAENDLTLVVSPVPPGLGLLFVSPRTHVRPLVFGDLCVGRPRHLGGLAGAHGGEWRLELDLQHGRLGRWIQPGETWTMQVFYRDRGLRPPLALSDAIEVTFEE